MEINANTVSQAIMVMLQLDHQMTAKQVIIIKKKHYICVIY